MKSVDVLVENTKVILKAENISVYVEVYCPSFKNKCFFSLLKDNKCAMRFFRRSWWKDTVSFSNVSIKKVQSIDVLVKYSSVQVCVLSKKCLIKSL